MTDIVFHFNVPDRMVYACQLARRAFRREALLTVTASEQELHEFSHRLWHLSPMDFLAHCHLPQAEEALVAASRIMLCADLQLGASESVLLNLGARQLVGFERFQRVVEVVSLEEDDRAQARTRWRQYAAAGHTISRRDAAEAGRP